MTGVACEAPEDAIADFNVISTVRQCVVRVRSGSEA
jgi:hypothetical protein